jgi:hypothetical protein
VPTNNAPVVRTDGVARRSRGGPLRVGMEVMAGLIVALVLIVLVAPIFLGLLDDDPDECAHPACKSRLDFGEARRRYRRDDQ